MTDLARSSRLDGTADGALATNLPGSDLHTEVGVDVDHELDLAAGLGALDGQLGDGLLGLPDNLAGLLLLILVGVEIGVVFVALGLLLLGLGLGLRDLDVADTLTHADEHITALLGGVVLRHAAGGESGLGVHQGFELRGAAGGDLDTDGVLKVRSGGDHGVDGLFDVLLVELLDERGLDGGTTRNQLGGVDGADQRRGGQDLGGLGEDVAGQLGDLGGVRGATGEDDLGSLLERSFIRRDKAGKKTPQKHSPDRYPEHPSWPSSRPARSDR